jgi:hypothetical protein
VSTTQGAEPLASAAVGRPRVARVLVWFFGLTYLVSWAWLIPLALAGQMVQQGRGRPTHLPALMGPMCAAVIVTAMAYGAAGLRDLGRRLVHWRVGWGWWLAAVSPVLMLPIALLVGRIGGASMPSAGEFASFTGDGSRGRARHPRRVGHHAGDGPSLGTHRSLRPYTLEPDVSRIADHNREGRPR